MESLAWRVREKVDSGRCPLQVITSAASLAHQGLLGPVRRLWLEGVDLTSIPAEHMAALVSSATWSVLISNVSGCDFVTILDSVKSQWLNIYDQSLGLEETQALSRAMETRVEEVGLNRVIVDIEALTKYNGFGKCWHVSCRTYYLNKEKLKTWAWAKSIDWKVIPSEGYSRCVEIKRPYNNIVR